MRMSRTKNDYIHVCVCVYLTPDIVYLESLRRLAEFGTWYVLLIKFHRNLAADQPRLFPQRRSYRSDSCWHILPKEERKWRLLLICQPKCDCNVTASWGCRFGLTLEQLLTSNCEKFGCILSHLHFQFLWEFAYVNISDVSGSSRRLREDSETELYLSLLCTLQC